MDLLVAAGDLVAVLVQLEVGHLQHTVPGGVLHGATQDRVHPGEQFLDAERLDDVVVGPGAQAADAIAGGVACGQEDDRHLGARGAQLGQ